jgi:hypothetical protein
MKSALSCNRLLWLRVALISGGCCLAQSSWAQVVPNPDLPACSFNDVKAAIQRLRDAGPEFAGVLDAIANAKKLCVVSTTSFNAKQVRSFKPYGSGILWEPDTGGARYNDGVCQDPTASLAHEVYHCFQVAMGPVDRWERPAASRLGPQTPAFLRNSEKDAVLFENRYRAAQGLSQRTTYGDALVPGTAPSTVNPLSTPCPQTPSSCGLQNNCCCWVYGGIKKNNAWYACTIDKVDPDVCNSLTIPNQSSASCQTSPCNFPGTPACF